MAPEATDNAPVTLYLTSIAERYAKAKYPVKGLVVQGAVVQHQGLSDNMLARLAAQQELKRFNAFDAANLLCSYLTRQMGDKPLHGPMPRDNYATVEAYNFGVLHLGYHGFFRVAALWHGLLKALQLPAGSRVLLEVAYHEQGVRQGLAERFPGLEVTVICRGQVYPAVLRRLKRWTEASLARLGTPAVRIAPKQGYRVLVYVSAVKHHFEFLRPLLRNIEAANADRPPQAAPIEVCLLVHSLPGLTPATGQTLAQVLAGLSYHAFWIEAFTQVSLRGFGPTHRQAAAVVPDYDFMASLDPLHEVAGWYRAMHNAFGALKPDVCLHMGIHYPGRVLADTARQFGVPSINLQYGLFTDNAVMASAICYDIRASINEGTNQIWRQRSDLSRQHATIGFCKHDELKQKPVEREAFLSELGLLPDRPTLFFASTTDPQPFGFYNDLKRWALGPLAELCTKRGWNLLVKLHPLETDDIARTILSAFGNPQLCVRSHAEATLAECIYVADVAVHQASTIVLEALYYGTPTCFLLPEVAHPELLSMLADTPYLPTFHSAAGVGAYLERLLDPAQRAAVQAQLRALQAEYLYRADGQASKRLLELLLDPFGAHDFPVTPNLEGPQRFAAQVAQATTPF